MCVLPRGLLEDLFVSCVWAAASAAIPFRSGNAVLPHGSGLLPPQTRRKEEERLRLAAARANGDNISAVTPPQECRDEYTLRTEREVHGKLSIRRTARALFSKPLPAGTVVAGRYEIISLLGRGGYSAVYRASDRELKREIALKIIRPERVSTTTEFRLRCEVNIARQTEAGEFHRAVVGGDQHVLRLDVAMNRFHRVQRFQSAEHLRGDAHGVGDAEAVVTRHFLA